MLVEVKRKVNIVQAHVWSRGLFQCGSWSGLTGAQYQKIHGAVMCVYRHVGGFKNNMGVSDDDIIMDLGVMCPKTMIRARRIMAFAKACASVYMCDAFFVLEHVDGILFLAISSGRPSSLSFRLWMGRMLLGGLLGLMVIGRL